LKPTAKFGLSLRDRELADCVFESRCAGVVAILAEQASCVEDRPFAIALEIGLFNGPWR